MGACGEFSSLQVKYRISLTLISRTSREVSVSDLEFVKMLPWSAPGVSKKGGGGRGVQRGKRAKNVF